MSAQPEKSAKRRRRSTPRRVMPTITQESSQKPFIFGWGTELTRHQRDAFKERIALFGGIGLAIVVIGILGWGVINDRIIQPAAQRAANSK
ncbi:MAG: hypothetical protein ACRDFX_08605, partial [Chloroflexota bacterium]